MEKICTKCGKSKPIEEFYKNRTTADGLERICKPCKYEYMRQLRTRKDAGAKVAKRTYKRKTNRATKANPVSDPPRGRQEVLETLKSELLRIKIAIEIIERLPE